MLRRDIDEKRNFGIDLLRILAMLMVVIIHINGQGGILAASECFTSQYYVVWIIEIAVFCGVNCYGLISGYVGVNARYKISNIIYLWVRVVFYTSIITLLFYVFYPGKVGLFEGIKAIFPVMFGQYWYFTAYFALFFIMPMLNFCVNTMERRQLKAVIASGFVIFSILPTIFHVDRFGTYGGCSVLWLIFLYVTGAYIRKYDIFSEKSSLFFGCAYVAVLLVTFLSKVLIEVVTLKILGKPFGGGYLISYTSPTIVLAAISLLLFFGKMELAKGLKKIVAFISPLAFSVYLIHTHPLVWEHILKDRFAGWINSSAPMLTLKILFTAVLIFGMCVLLDWIRKVIFTKLKIREHLENIEARVLMGIKDE